MNGISELFQHLKQLKRDETRVALATLVNTRGTTPRKEGAQMLVGEGGRVLGSVTIGGCVDAQVIEESAGVLGQNAPRLLELNLGDEEAWEIGLTCGGTIEVFVEPVALDRPGEPTLAFYEKARAHADRGGRAAIITKLDPPQHGAKLLLLDSGAQEGTLGDSFLDRRFAAEARETVAAGKSKTLFLEGVRSFVEVFAPPSILLVVGDVPLIATTALVLVAHDYKYDLPVLRHALTTPVGYIGLLGSTRRGAAIFNLLREDGVGEEALGRVRVPIGLDLGAQSAPEIALSILAEILSVQRGATALPISEKVKRGIR